MYFNDVQALSDKSFGLLFALMGGFGILFSVLVGSIGDRYGVRLALITGTFMHVMHYVVLIITKNIYIQIASLLCFSCLGSALVGPSLQAGIKRFSSQQYRNIAISCFWCMFYLGSLCSSIVLQVFLSFFDKTEDDFNILFIVMFFLATTGFILSLYLSDNERPNILNRNQREINPINSGWKHTMEILALKRIWRLIAVICLLVIIKSVFFQQIIVLPLYMDREIGEDTYFGFMVMLNQVIIITFIPVLAFTANYCSAYNSFIIAGSLSVISPLGFVLVSNYISVLTFIAISSIGEGMLAFRMAEYTLKIAPEGRETVVVALSAIPMVFSLIFSGLIGGFLMNSYCPDGDGNECWKVWGFISLIALPPTLMLLLLRYWIEDRESETTPYIILSAE